VAENQQNKLQRESTYRREEDLSIKGPLGWEVRANGKQVISLIFVLATVGILGYMIRDHDVRAAEALKEAVASRDKQLATVQRQQEELKDSVDTITYVLSLAQEDRQKLKLDMPAALRNKLLTQERPH
jgi:hypothetical protein